MARDDRPADSKSARSARRRAKAESHLPNIREAGDRFRASHHYHEPGSRADLQFQFTGRMNLIARRYRTRLNEELREIAQTQARWDALFWIAVSEEGVTQSELAERMGIEGPTLVRMLNKLEQEGLVERRSTPGDRRAKTIRLRGAAEDVLAKIAAISAPVREDILQDVDSDELRACLSVFDRVMARLERD